MDSFDTLLARKKYDLIIKATNNAHDAPSIFYRIVALASSLKVEAALECLKNNRKVLEKDSLKTLMPIHFDLLFLLEKFDEAYEELAYYKELPYDCQEVEEFLRDLPKLIRKKEKESYNMTQKELSKEEIIKRLDSDSAHDIIEAVDSLRGKDLTSYLGYLKKILVSFPKQSIRTFTLFLLIESKLNTYVDFNSLGRIISVNPALLDAPFEGDDFKKISDCLTKDLKDTTLERSALQILSSYLMLIYPKSISSDDVLTITAIRLVGKKYLMQDLEVKLEAQNNNLNESELLQKVEEIEKLVNNF